MIYLNIEVVVWLGQIITIVIFNEFYAIKNIKKASMRMEAF